MRPNHQKNRMRGRNRGNGGGGGGKGPNPLTRSYESNGPDVKVRGTAQNIAEKYLQLGRDAQATGDHVQAESYFQHAEHYFRLIAAAQEQFRLQNPGYRGFDQQEGEGDEGEDEGSFNQGGPQTEPRGYAASQPSEGDDEQPRSEGQSREFVPRGPRPPFRDRDQQQRGFQPREHREPREQREPRDQREPREQRDNRGFQPREQREPRFHRQPAPMPLEAEQPGLPSFITAPVRPVAIDADQPSETSTQGAAGHAPQTADAADFAAPIGVRRRGRPPRVRVDEGTAGDE